MIMTMTVRTASMVAVVLLFPSMADYCVNSAESNNSIIPVIDIQAWTQSERHSDAERLTVAHAVDEACRGIGFFAIQNHGVDPRIIEHAWNVTQAFFDLPLPIKLQSKTDNDKEYPYGYENGSEKLQVGKKNDDAGADAAGQYEATPPDLKETFSIGPYNAASGQLAPRFPAQPVDFEAALSAYYRALEQLARLLLHIFAVALQLPNPESWFANKMNRHISALRILNYPPIIITNNKDNTTSISTTVEGQLRASAHTDYGVFTILKSGGPGLQVKKDVIVEDGQNHHDWIDVPNLNDTFIINIGDLMQRWTNGKAACVKILCIFSLCTYNWSTG
jgi:isopenicillin N synthase-like dioxygenase